MKKWFPARGLAASLLTAALLAALVQSTSAAPPDGETQTLKGAVQRFNHSPKGEYDSLLMKTNSKLVQINFPPHMASQMAKVVAAGDQISVVVVPNESKGDHPVYEIQKLTTSKSEEISPPKPKPHAKPKPKHEPGAKEKPKPEKPEAKPHAKPKPKPHAKPKPKHEPGEKEKPKPEPKLEGIEKIEGKVKYLNYARHGEVNGAVLASGDFVHLGPHGAEILKLSVGQKLKVEGQAAPMPDGHKVIEHPIKVNDMEVPRGRPHEKSPPKPPHQKEGPRPEKKPMSPSI